MQVEASGRDGNTMALSIQEDIGRLHEALTGLSGDFIEHKRLTQQVQGKLSNQVSALEDSRQRSQPQEELMSQTSLLPGLQERSR